MAHGQWFSSSNQSDFLPVMEAFQPSAWHDGDTLSIGVDIADEYYLYRHQLDVTSQQASVDLEDPIIPQGSFTTDQFMGDVYVFRDQLVFDVPLSAPYSGPISIELTFQGCADAGLCYPPERITLEAAETSPPSTFANWQYESEQSSPNQTSTGEPTPSSAATQSGENAGFSAPQSEDSKFSALISDTSLPLALG
ncbi:MAG: protein-disulfide reductase DsbD domain-containing protein, partial [Pseudomonadota bacterium]|nr:protein-disulfide reductase DsbD domain-containing protein [Pseudomonadota bacterium]